MSIEHIWMHQIEMLFEKKTYVLRNQRNWNVEQLDMQCNQFSVWFYLFFFRVVAIAVHAAHLCSQNIICMKLIGAWL